MDILLYTAGEFQAGIAIVAVAVAVVMWLVCRIGYGRQLRDVSSRFTRYREQSRKVSDELEKANHQIISGDEKIDSLNATIAQGVEDLAAEQKTNEEWAEHNEIWHGERESLEIERENLKSEVVELSRKEASLTVDLSEIHEQIDTARKELFEVNTTANEYKKKFAGEKSGHDRLKKAYDKVLAEVTRMTNELKTVNAKMKDAEKLANSINVQLAEVLKEKADLQQALTDIGISKTGVRHKLTAQIVKYGQKFGVRLAHKEGKRTLTEWESGGLMVTETAAKMKVKKLETAVIEIESGE